MYTIRRLEEMAMSQRSQNEVVLFSVLLLPAHEVVAQGLTQREAEAWVRTYNDALGGRPCQAILAEEAVPLRPAA
jgi:hypothetical protein